MLMRNVLSKVFSVGVLVQFQIGMYPHMTLVYKYYVYIYTYIHKISYTYIWFHNDINLGSCTNVRLNLYLRFV